MGSPGPQGPGGGVSSGGGARVSDMNSAGAVHVRGLGGKLGGKAKSKPAAAKPVVRKPVTRKGAR